MKPFLFNLALAPCSLFIFSLTVYAHPHKTGEIHHGPSLENYQIELDFSANHLANNEPVSNIKIADKNKSGKAVTGKKTNKSKTMQKNQQKRKQQKENKK